VLRPFHRGHSAAPTAELLMRSRYTAFAVGDADYLRATWHPDTRPRRVPLDPATSWTRLEVLGSTGGGLFDSAGTVAFRAHHRTGMVRRTARFDARAGGGSTRDRCPIRSRRRCGTGRSVAA
jgi:SEC-C motif-containing protein